MQTIFYKAHNTTHSIKTYWELNKRLPLRPQRLCIVCYYRLLMTAVCKLHAPNTSSLQSFWRPVVSILQIILCNPGRQFKTNELKVSETFPTGKQIKFKIVAWPRLHQQNMQLTASNLMCQANLDYVNSLYTTKIKYMQWNKLKSST